MKYTLNEIIEKFKLVHGDRYDYSKFLIGKSSTKSTIVCPIHGEFSQTYKEHVRGRGCRDCGYKKVAKRLNKGCSYYIQKASLIHNNKYNYQNVESCYTTVH